MFPIHPVNSREKSVHGKKSIQYLPGSPIAIVGMIAAGCKMLSANIAGSASRLFAGGHQRSMTR